MSDRSVISTVITGANGANQVSDASRGRGDATKTLGAMDIPKPSMSEIASYCCCVRLRVPGEFSLNAASQI